MTITFTEEKEVVVVKERKVSILELKVLEVTDNPERKSVIARTDKVGTLLLWEKEAYDAIGQWTDTDVINRINELIA